MQDRRRLAQGLGRGVAALRARHGLRQEDVAFAAQEFGLPWTRSVVNALEHGRRLLDAEELVLLTRVAARAVGRPVGLDDLLFESVLVGGLEMNLETIGPALSEKAEAVGAAVDAHRVGYRRTRASDEEAVRKAAVKLETRPSQLEDAAFELWGHGFVPERDIRVAQQIEADGGVPEEAPPRTVQALRGHVTRRLLEELRPMVEHEERRPHDREARRLRP